MENTSFHIIFSCSATFGEEGAPIRLRIRRDPFLSRRNLFKKSHKGCRNCVKLALKARKLAYRAITNRALSGNARRGPSQHGGWLGVCFEFLSFPEALRDWTCCKFFRRKPPSFSVVATKINPIPTSSAMSTKGAKQQAAGPSKNSRGKSGRRPEVSGPPRPMGPSKEDTAAAAVKAGYSGRPTPSSWVSSLIALIQ